MCYCVDICAQVQIKGPDRKEKRKLRIAFRANYLIARFKVQKSIVVQICLAYHPSLIVRSKQYHCLKA